MTTAITTKKDLETAIEAALEKYPVEGYKYLNEEEGGELVAFSLVEMPDEDIQYCEELLKKATESGIEEKMTDLVEISYAQSEETGSKVIGEEWEL